MQNVKMAKQSVDGKIFGDEPTIDEKSSVVDIALAYNWYNYYFDNNDAKEFVIFYLKENRFPKVFIENVDNVPAPLLRNIGWNSRILTNGGYISSEQYDAMMDKLNVLIDKYPVIKQDTPVVNVQDRIENKTSEIIGDLEKQIDEFVIKYQSDFDVSQFFRDRSIKPLVAKKIHTYYSDLQKEINEAIDGVNPDLKYAYRRWKKVDLKKFSEFVGQIISACEMQELAVVRKPRKKKVKPAAILVRDLKYKPSDAEYKLVSAKPVEIVGSEQVWLFNTEKRSLCVINTDNIKGLSVKGTTIINFDEKTSMIKKIRKPDVILPKVLSGGKVVLRKLMNDIKAKEKPATGRINSDTIILRVIKK
jgi:hypothetical protein